MSLLKPLENLSDSCRLGGFGRHVLSFLYLSLSVSLSCLNVALSYRYRDVVLEAWVFDESFTRCASLSHLKDSLLLLSIEGLAWSSVPGIDYQKDLASR